MAQASRTIRLFVSSTFSDMKAERDILQREVFPRLKQICLSKGLRFQAIDLRWGVSEEAGRHNRTMRICLRELARCQEGTPKPNFLMLLGDRYGWRPLPETIPADLFEKMKPLVKADDPQAAPALEWYRRDDNAVPPEYVLQPRTGALADYDAWRNGVETPLLAALESAAAFIRIADTLTEAQHRALDQLALGLSATHQEIIRGALTVSDAREHVHAFVRTIRYAPGEQPHRDLVDLLPGGAQDPRAGALREGNSGQAKRLSHLQDPRAGALREGLRGEIETCIGPNNTHPYTLDWRDEGRFSDDDLRQFHSEVLTALTAVVIAQAEKLTSVPAEQQEEQAHEAFGGERCAHFLGREEPLRRIERYLTRGAGRPLAVLGVAGSGKSAVMAEAARQAIASHSTAVIIERYIGATPGSSDVISLLRDIVGAVRRRYPKQSATGDPAVPDRDSPPPPSDADVPVELNPLIAAFQEALRRPTADKPLILFLDALDQLSEPHGAQPLLWLPATLPEHVRLVVSAALPDGNDADRVATCKALESVTHAEDRIVLGKLEPNHGAELLKLWTGLEGRKLQPPQRDAVLALFPTEGNPLWLRTTAVEAARLASWEPPPRFPADTPGLIRQVLSRLSAEENHGPMLVDRALAYLACARHGLAEDEMLDILSLDTAVMSDVIRRSPIERAKPETERIKALPAAVWVALRGDIARYLGEHEAQGAVLMRFYHRSFRVAVESAFLRERTVRAERHAHLSQVFSRQPWTLPAAASAEPSLSDPPNPRKTSELPWHLFLSAENTDPERQCPEVWDSAAACLCDLRLVEAKIRAGQLLELQTDYRMTQASLPENQNRLREDREREARVQRWTNEIIAYAAAWSNRRDRLGRGEPVLEPEPMLPEVVPSCRMWTDEEIQAECDRIVKAPTRSDRLEAFTTFVASQCYPLVANGCHPGFVLQHASNIASAGPVHDTAGDLLAGLTEPYLLRRWPPSVRSNVRQALLRTLEGHSNGVYCVSVTPDGRRAVSSSEMTLRVWDLETGQCLRILEGHTYSVHCVSMTPDGRRAVSGSDDQTLRVWDLESGQCLRTLKGHSGWVRCVDITPDGWRAISGGHDTTLRVWDLETGQCLRKFKGHTRDVDCVSMTPDGRRVVSGSGATLQVWDLESEQCLHTLNGCTAFTSVSVTPDGRWAVSGSWENTPRVWDLESGQCLRMLEGHTGYVDCVSVTMDGRWAVSGSRDETLRVWELESGRCLRILEAHTNSVYCVGVTPDGRRAVSGSGDKTLRVWDLESGQCLRPFEGHTRGVQSVSVTPDGRVVSGGLDKTLRVWGLESGQCLNTLKGHTKQVQSVCVTPDGRGAVSGSYDKTLRIWDLESGQCLHTLEGHRWVVGSVTVTADGGRAVSVSWDQTLRVWDIESGQCLHTLVGHTNCVDLVGVTQDGRRAVSGSQDNTLRVWDLESGRCLRMLEGHSGPVYCLSVMPDGRRAVSGSWDKTLRVWDLESGQCLRTLVGHSDWVRSVRVTSDGRRAISGGGDTTLREWDLESGKCLRTLEGHTDYIWSVSITQDGRRVVSGSGDKTLRVWDLGSGQCLVMFAYDAVANCVKLAQDGRTVVVGTSAGEVLFLEIHGLS